MKSMPGAGPLFAWSLIVSIAAGQGLEERPSAHFQVPNAPVLALARQDDVLFVGGDFDRVGTYTGPFCVITRARAAQESFPGIHGEVHAIADDGAGGWFVGGNFDRVGDEVRRGVVHLRADGSIAPWNPSVRGTVTALLRVENTLYLGGRFDLANGAQNDLAALDVESAERLPWNPLAGAQLGSSTSVNTLLRAGTAVLVGGFFPGVVVGGAMRSHLALLDGETGVGLPCPSVNGSVFDALVTPHGLFLAGNFSVVAGASRERLAWLLPSGALGPVLPAPDRTVQALARIGAMLYLGGDFGVVAGAPRTHLAAIDLRTRQLTSFAPEVAGFDGRGTQVTDLEVDGQALLVAGAFRTLAGSERRSFGAVDLAGGVLPTDPRLAGAPSSTLVRKLALTSGALAIGGDFLVRSASVRVGLAAYDLPSGQLRSFAPTAEGVRALAVDGRRLFAGGTFNAVNGVARPRLAVLDAVTGALESTFDARYCSNSGTPFSLAGDGERLFVGGNCLARCGENCHSLEGLDARTGERLSGWDVDTNLPVHEVVSAPGGVLYLAGTFESVGSLLRGFEPRNGLAALEAASGLVLPWNPAAVLGDGSTLFARSDRVLAGGTWQSIGGAHRAVAELDAVTAMPTSWEPRLEGIGTVGVSSIAASEHVIYLAGAFTTVGGQFHPQLVAVDGSSGAPLDWSPEPQAVSTLLWTDVGLVVAGGSTWKHAVLANLCLFRPVPGSPASR